MKGSILSYSAEHKIGKILADNQQQYTFTAEHWSETHAPTIGEHIDFEVNEYGFITKVTGYIPQNIQIPSFPPLLNSSSHLDPAEANYNIFNWFLKSLKNYANFTGRARRKELWFFSLVYFIIYISLFLIEFKLWTYPILTMLFALAMIIPSLSVQVRRLHDINKSGWSMCISFIPLVGGIILLIWLCTETKFEDNQWGKPAK